jgi:hypothetical protein
LAVGQTQAAPKEDRGKGRGGERAAAASQGARSAATVRSVTPSARSAARVSSNGAQARVNSQARVSRNDLTHARVSRDTSTQAAIRSATPQRNYVARDTDNSARVTTTRVNRDRDGRRDGDRDRDRDRDRDWDGRRDRDWNDRRYRPSYDVYRNWDRNRVYSWNNNRYRWYGGAWVIYDSPTVVYSDSYPVISASVVAEAQAELRRRGFYYGAVDGVAGPQTRDAIAEFQNARGLAVTGRLNNATLGELGVI